MGPLFARDACQSPLQTRLESFAVGDAPARADRVADKGDSKRLGGFADVIFAVAQAVRVRGPGRALQVGLEVGFEHIFAQVFDGQAERAGVERRGRRVAARSRRDRVGARSREFVHNSRVRFDLVRGGRDHRLEESLSRAKARAARSRRGQSPRGSPRAPRARETGSNGGPSLGRRVPDSLRFSCANT